MRCASAWIQTRDDILKSMATQALPRRRPPTRRKKKSKAGWLAWWPLLLAIIATPFAVRAAEILPLMGPAGLVRLRLLYPFALLAQQHFGLTEARAETVSQVLMYTQFPLYSLLLMLMRRIKSIAAGLCVLLVVHLIAVAAVWLLPAH